MPYPLPLTRTEAYLAYKAGVVQQSDLKPSLAVPRNGIDAWLAYWTGLAEDYPKREDGTPHILQEEEAYIAYLCGVINEYPEKCLRRVGAYLRYLISARWGRPDHPLNREELYLSLIKTQFIPSGDPSSDIVIDGTAKAPFVDVKMYGDTFQQTYTGKNLVATARTVETKNGVTCTWDGASFTLNGTSTANVDFYGRGWWGTTSDPIALPTGTYTMSLRKSDGSLATDADFSVDCYYGTTWVIGIYKGNSGAGYRTVTFDSDTQYSVFYISLVSGKTYNNEKFYVQLEKSESPTSYEPFVGGQPSPSPEYPQQIQTVTGKQTVEVQGKNLFDVTATPWYISRAYDKNGESVYWTGYVAIIAYQPVEPNSTYTFSNSAGKAIYFGLVFYDADKNKISNVYSYTRTFTTPANCHYVRFAIQNNTIPTWTQLEKGSTATTYEPYSANDYEINLGKNLFDGENANAKTGYILNDSGTEVSDNTGGYTRNYSAVRPNTTYTISGMSNAGTRRIYFYNGSKTFLSRSNGYTSASSITFTTPANCYFVNVQIYTRTDDATSIALWQLESGSEATSYAPYFTPIELCKLGTYQDYIWKDGEDWKIHKAISKYVFYGSQDEEWIVTGNCFRPEGVVFDGLIYDPVTTNAKSNLATVWKNSTGSITSSMPNLRFGWAASGTKKLAVRFDKIKQGKPDSEALESWINILSGTPMAVYFEALSASDIIIDNAALLSQLEALVAGGAENGTTYIKVKATDPNLPGLLYVEAPKYE